MIANGGRVYRLLGAANVPLTFAQLDDLVRRGLLSVETKVIRDGEGFATAISARSEFQHLLPPDQATTPEPSGWR